MREIPVVIHADDLGLSRSFNRGIFLAATRGLVRSTCLRTNGLAYREAIEDIFPQLNGVGIGVHLNIVEGFSGRSVTSRSRLCDGDGRYLLGFAGLWRAAGDPHLLGEIKADFRDQIETVLQNGVKVDHLNSHQHSHLLPPLFNITCALAKEYGIPFVRLVKERWHSPEIGVMIRPWYWANLAKFGVSTLFASKNETTARSLGVRTNNAFVGLLHTGHMTWSSVRAGLEASCGQGSIEVLLHPAEPVAEDHFGDISVESYAKASERAMELSLACDAEFVKYLSLPPWRLTNYRELASLPKGLLP